MNDKIFVIAGDYNQFMSYKLRKSIGDKFIYVSGVDVLRGQRDPHGVFIGTWRQRDDIHVILDELAVRCGTTTTRERLNDLRKSLPPMTEKQAISIAGAQMAKSIDAELIQQFNGGSMTARQEDYAVSYESLIPTLIKAVQELNTKVNNLETP